MSKRVVSWMVVQVGRFGLAARGIVIGIAGVFLIVAALRFDPSEATGLGGALQELLKQSFGSWLLGVAALGLTAYGPLMLAVARYGQIALGRPF
jgi:choline-glycine betaine transporter